MVIKFDRQSISGEISGLATPYSIEYEFADKQEAKDNWDFQISFYVPLERMTHIFSLNERSFERLEDQLSRILA